MEREIRMTITFWIIIALGFVLSLFLAVVSWRERKENQTLTTERDAALSKIKSSEVRLGHIVEKLAPFLEDFPHDPRHCIFLGQPIDYIAFDPTNGKVTFIEVKSGQSKLSKKQRKIRDAVQNNQVDFEIFRVDSS